MNYIEIEATAESLARRLGDNPSFQFGIRDALTGFQEEIEKGVSDAATDGVRKALDDRLAKFVAEAVVKRLAGVDDAKLRIALAGILDVCKVVPPTERSPRALHATIAEIIRRCHAAGVIE